MQVRAPDYDDWTLNGDIIVRHPCTGYRHELSSMGVRVDAEVLKKQLEHRGMSDRLQLDYHKAIVEEQLPLCIGGGIGISRLLMLLLQRGHIGEVQVRFFFFILITKKKGTFYLSFALELAVAGCCEHDSVRGELLAIVMSSMGLHALNLGKVQQNVLVSPVHSRGCLPI